MEHIYHIAVFEEVSKELNQIINIETSVVRDLIGLRVNSVGINNLTAQIVEKMFSLGQRVYFKKDYKSFKLRYKNRKLFFISQKGGKCQICGYNKNLAVLSFHHRENTKKCFSLSASAFSSKPINILQIEADKCDLLCSNCHLELHYPQYNL